MHCLLYVQKVQPRYLAWDGLKYVEFNDGNEKTNLIESRIEQCKPPQIIKYTYNGNTVEYYSLVKINFDNECQLTKLDTEICQKFHFKLNKQIKIGKENMPFY